MKIFSYYKKIKLFTLIELIVVIVVLGILAAIVVPNISSFQSEAEGKAIISNARNIQTSVDMFVLENNGATPTKEKPTLGNPQIIQLHGLKPDYLRDVPKTKRAKYWLDYNNTVWASTVDAPTKVEYNEGDKKLTWNTVDGAEMYKIYKSSSSDITTASNLKDLIEIKTINTSATNNVTPEVIIDKSSEDLYLVSAVDIYDLESPPTAIGSTYTGYVEPEKDFNIIEFQSNKAPLASINVSLPSSIYVDTVLSFDSNTSSDPEGHSILQKEWKVDGNLVSSLPSTFSLGKHTIALRVQDELGKWSEWVSKEFTVVEKQPVSIYNGFSFTQYTNNDKTFNYDRVSNKQPIRFNFYSEAYHGKIYSDQGTRITIWEDGVSKGTKWLYGNGSSSMSYTYYPSKDNFSLRIRFESLSSGTAARASWYVYQYPQ